MMLFSFLARSPVADSQPNSALATEHNNPSPAPFPDKARYPLELQLGKTLSRMQ